MDTGKNLNDDVIFIKKTIQTLSTFDTSNSYFMPKDVAVWLFGQSSIYPYELKATIDLLNKKLNQALASDKENLLNQKPN